MKNFGEFKVAKLAEKEVSGENYVIETIRELQDEVRLLNSKFSNNKSPDTLTRVTQVKRSIIGFLVKDNKVRKTDPNNELDVDLVIGRILKYLGESDREIMIDLMRSDPKWVRNAIAEIAAQNSEKS